MIRFLPIILPIIWGLGMVHFSVYQTRRRLSQQSKPLEHPRLQAGLDRLAYALDLDHIPVREYQISTINGLADTDGKVYLTTGMLQQMDRGQLTPDEITSVIAHELGHVALGHGPRRMRDFAGQNALRVGVTMLLARLVPGIGPWIANLLISVLAAKLSRRDEFEADAYASALLIKAGIGVTPQISMFHKLEQITGNRGRANAWMASHPDSAARIQAIESNAEKWD